MLLNEFLAPQLSASNIDRFLVRSSILKEIKNILPELKGTLLDIGCGEMPYRELFLSETSQVQKYLGIDIENPIYQQQRRPDLFWDGITMPLEDNSIDCAVATELFEHLPDLAGVLKEIRRVLKPEGILFFTIPFLWPLHDVPNDEYRYTPFSLERIFRKTGFTDINIKAMGGWNASLAQMIGLWLRRSPISETQRKEYSEVLFPLYKYLIDNDSLPSNFKESIMITGLTGTVKNNKYANSLKLNNIEFQEKKDGEKKICLAIFTPQVGVISETFITNHIKYLAPGHTVVFTGKMTNALNFDVPIIIAPFVYTSNKFSQEEANEIVKQFEKYKISHLLLEYGCEGRGIVELNFLKMHLPLYIHFHGYDASLILRNHAIVEYYKWMGGIATGIITVSNNMKSKLAAAGIPEEKIVVIPYGVNIHIQRTSIPPEPPVKLIAVSRLVAKKGIIFLLKAILKAKQMAPSMILNIIGEGPLRSEIEEFISTNNLNNSVSLLGALPHDIVKKIMNDSHIFIQHSITDPVTGDAEGLPNTILEASAAGLPIISTFHEGIPDAVEHDKTGLLVQEFDIDTMAEYIVSLSLNSSLREKMGTLGREKMTKDFQLKGQIQKLQMLLGLPKEEFSNILEELTVGDISTGPITPLISICIPTYNRTKYIGETIQQVLNQTYTKYEIVIVDDGSTEDIKSIIYKFKNDKIRYIRKEHTNAADTRNRCIDESRGEFILWQDDDDYPDPELLKEYVKTLNLLPNLDVVYSYQRVHEAESGKISIRKFEDWYFNRHNLTENLLYANQFMFCGGLYKKSIYKKIGKFNTKFIRAHDYEMAFRIALNENLKLKLVPKILYNYRQFDHGTLSGSLKDKDYRYEWAILNKVLSLEQFQKQFSEEKLGIIQSAAFYFKLAIRYSQFNCLPKTIELLEKSIALKADEEAISFLNKTRSSLTKLLQKRKEVLSFLTNDKNNPELNSYLNIIDKFISPFNQNEFFQDDEFLKGYSPTNFELNIPYRQKESTKISVIIATYNRPLELEKCLNGFCYQTLSKNKFEIVLVDDFSTLSIDNIVNKFLSLLPIVYLKHKVNKGLAASRNTGLTIAKGNIVLFFDDDDCPSENYLDEHLKVHAEYPQENVAVLGHTNWDPDLKVTPVMNHITKVGEQYMAYGGLKPLSLLPWHYFWGGRASIKKSFLDKHGYYDENCRVSLEDIELNYRLKEHDFKVVYNPSAVSYMTKAITTEDFCNRCKKQGPGIAYILNKHRDDFLIEHFGIQNAEKKVSILFNEIENIKSDINILENSSSDELKENSTAVIDGRTLNKEDLLNYEYKLLFEYYKLEGFLKAQEKIESISKNILIIAPELPTFDRSSGGFRLFQLVKVLRTMEYNVTFIARAGAGTANATPYINELQKLGVTVYPVDPDKIYVKWKVRVDAPKLDLQKILSERSYDFVYLYFHELAEQYVDEIRTYSPNSKVLIDSVDIHFIREIREAELKRDESLLKKAILNKNHEISIYGKADYVITVTEADKYELLKSAADLNVKIIPNIHPPVEESIPGFEERQDLLFVGGFLHQPNVDAIIYFIKDIFPQIKEKLPDVKLFIAGNEPPEELKILANENVIVTGFVKDLGPFLKNCKLSIAPLRFGAGMKGKVGEAMNAGLPVVATSIAAEGIGAIDGDNILIADEPNSFAEAVIKLYQDEKIWNLLSSSGKTFIRDQYSPNAIKKDLAIIFNECQDVVKEKENLVDVSVIIPVHNNLQITKSCLESLGTSTSKFTKEIIIINNGSTKDIAEYLNSLGETIRCIHNNENLSYSRINNQGAAIAKGRYLLFLNNDTQLFPGWLEALTAEFERDNKTGIQGGKLLYPNDTIQHAGIVFGKVNSGEKLHYHIYLTEPANAPHVNIKREFQMVTGALLAIRADLFREINGFDEKYVFGHEDLDLCMAIRQAGYKVVYNPAIQAYHFESMTKKLNGLEKYALNLNDHSSADYKNYTYFHSKWDKLLLEDADDYYIEDGFKTIHDLKYSITPKKIKNILFTMYGWNESGGGTIFPKEVTKELAKRGYNVSVFYASLKNDPMLPAYSIEKSIDDGVKLFGIFNRPAVFIDPDHPEREIRDSKLVEIFNDIIEEVKPDLVHFNNFHGLTLALAEEVKKKGIHSCYTPHNYHMIDPNLYLFNSDLSLWKGVDLIKNSESVRKNLNKKNLYLKRAETARKLMNNWIDVTLAVSSRQKELLVNFGIKSDKIAVVHQSNKSTDVLWEDPKLAVENNRVLTTPIKIGFIGGVMPQKGIHILAAAAQFFDKTEVEFHIYGFVFPTYLDQLKRIDVRNNLIFHGEYKQDQLTEIASQIDLAVVPSVWEDCAPLVILELHAMRLPLIASRIGGIPDFIEEGVNGFLYKYDSVEELRNKIKYCINDIDLISNMRKSIVPRHSFNKYVDHIETVYEKIKNTKWEIGEIGLKIESNGIPDNKRLNIIWEGSQFVNHSLAYINRELCQLLIEKGYNLSIIPYEQDKFQPAPKSPLWEIKELYHKKLVDTDLHVRHQWPPNLEAPEKGHWVIIQPWEFGSLPKEWVEVFIKSVDELWVPSNYVRQTYIDSGVPDCRVFVIPNGFNPAKFNPGIKPFKLKTKKKFKFLFVGGTIYRKGIDLLIESYIQTFKRSDDVCLVLKDICGDSFYKGQNFKDKISELRKQNHSPEIEYIDTILNEKELAGLYTACNVLVHPYRGEGFGLPILESMACGIPTIVTNGGACLDFCNSEISLLVNAEKFFLKEKKIDNMDTVDYPWLLEPSLLDLKQKMLFAFQNPDKIEEMGGEAMKYVSENFTWEKSFEKMAQRMEIVSKQPVIRLNKKNHEMPEPDHFSFDDLFAQASSLLESGDGKRALEIIIRAGKYFNPSEAKITQEDIYILTGNICLSLKELEGARVTFETALNSNPQSSEACFGLGMIFYQSGQLNEAKTMFEWAVNNDPDNKPAISILNELNAEIKSGIEIPVENEN